MSTYDIIVLVPLAAWVVVAALSCYGVWEFVRWMDPPPAVNWRPRIALIIAMRGVPPNFDALWQAIGAQTLPAHRVILAVEDKDDGAYAAIDSLPPGPVVREVAIAGLTSSRSQKIHNLLAAFGFLKPKDEIIVM